jgi:hypothetical protein
VEIEANRRSVQQLFAPVGLQYEVPAYQRPYAWGPEQVDRFWADIVESDGGGLFLGTLVLYKKGEQKREVIDGQQRLTTLQVLLAIIRDEFVKLGRTDLAQDPQSLIWSSAFMQGDDQFKLRSGKSNWLVLRDFILRHPEDARRKSFVNPAHVHSVSKAEWAKNKTLVDAYLRLKKSIDDHVEGSAAAQVTGLKSLAQKIVFHLDLVSIEVTGLADAFLLFETLNDRGLQLSAADLLKSHLLAKLDAKFGDPQKLDEASEDWDELVEQLGGGDITRYLRHFLLMTRKKVRKNEIFTEFQKDVKSIGPEALLEELLQMGERYGQFLHPRSADEVDVRQVLDDLQGLNVLTHYIALLPARRWLPAPNFVRFARNCEALSFRWFVCGLNAQELESIYQEASSILYTSKGQQEEEALETVLENLPGDETFRDSFRRQRLGVLYVARYALRRIEETRHIAGEVKPPSTVHVEHIMPRGMTEFWKERVSDQESYGDVVERWGNLTLLHKKPNQKIQNGDWSTKIAHYAGSEVIMTKELAVLEDWTSEAIDLRQQWLAIAASLVWSAEAAAGSETHIPFLADVLSDRDAWGIEPIQR